MAASSLLAEKKGLESCSLPLQKVGSFLLFLAVSQGPHPPSGPGGQEAVLKGIQKS